MIPPQGGKTFGLSHPAEYLDKLEWEFERLMKAGRADERELSYHAMNFIITAWHMTDWIYPHLPESEKQRFPKPKDFQNWIRSQSRTVAACRDVATAAKHVKVTLSPDPKIETVLGTKFVPSDPANQFQPHWLIAVDGMLYPMDEFCRKAISFWHGFLDMHGLLIDLE